MIWPKFLKVHFLNFLYDHKDYTNFDHDFWNIMKNFPKLIPLETNSSLQDGNKSENADWERDVLNIKRDVAKIVKNLFFRTTLPILSNNWEGKYPQIPKTSLFKRGNSSMMFYRHSIMQFKNLIQIRSLVLGRLSVFKKIQGKYSF